ncbi:MAG TPA: hypothetical protein DD671_11465, partial [Balneolaceae bacterium]|nr:hypothetical protein [Balneolaceae bacterium]
MKWLISLVLLITSTSALAQESLKPVPSTGKAYTVLIKDALLNESNLSIGDTVAVFDGDLSVGASEFQGGFPMVISAWEGDASQNLEGFKAGNPITFRVKSAIYDSVIVYEPTVTYEDGDGTFGYGAFTSVKLSHQTNFSPNISINNTSFDFGSVRRGNQATREFTISNTGNAQLQIYSISSNNNQISVDFANGEIADGGSQTVTVTYAPTTENPLDATLAINSSDPDNGVTTVEITGQGLPALAPVLSMEPNSYLLGNIKLQDS